MDLLMSIIALLFSLADAAEAASGRSRRIRRNVLAVMPRAEAAAQAALIKWARHFGAPITPQALLAFYTMPAEYNGDDPEDALRIAVRFRALALALYHLAAWAERFARRLTALAHTTQLGLPLSLAPVADLHQVSALPPFDTS
jgi:hypothetical protein